MSIRANWKKIIPAGVVLLLVFLVGSAVLVRNAYENALKPVSDSQQLVFITVDSGATVKEISSELKQNGLIKETWAFEWYVRNSNLTSDLKAGTYALRPSQDVEEIAKTVARGEVATNLVTIIPGSRLDQVEATLINSGFSPKEVIKALKPDQYQDHPALVDKPKGASLEGYLYPESFQKNDSTKATDIIEASLDEMQQRLTPKTRSAIAKQGLSIHEGVILASMIEQEVSEPKDKPLVAQVFLSRLSQGIKLESDATAPYGAVLDDEPPSLTYDSPYNTYLYKGLPKGPISNVSESSIKAVADPANTNYLFFVSGDDGTTYFSRTLEEHERNTELYCTKLC